MSASEKSIAATLQELAARVGKTWDEVQHLTLIEFAEMLYRMPATPIFTRPTWTDSSDDGPEPVDAGGEEYERPAR